MSVVALQGCTEPNPYLSVSDTGTGSSTGTITDAQTSTGSTGDLADESSGETGSTCTNAGGQCIDVAPEGWEGPFAWLERPLRLEPAPCPAPWDQLSTEVFSDISAPAAQCTCECGDLLGASCGPVAVEHHAQDDCTGSLLHSMEFSEGGCEFLTPDWGGGGGYSFASPAVVGGTCIPNADAQIQEASFLTRHRACVADVDSSGCAAEQRCAPTPQDPLHPRYCIWQDGDVPCPEGSAYSEHERLFRDLDDARGCEECTCTPPDGTCTGATLFVGTSAPACTPGPGVAADGCVAGPGANVNALIYSQGTPPTACEPAIVVPTGDASGAEPVSFCCTPTPE